MIWLYRLLFLPGLIIALPYYLFRMWRRGGYRKDFQHRLGRFRRLSSPAPGKTRIWLQAVSVGEVLAVGPLMEALQERGDIEIVLTTTTSTGYVEARKRYGKQVFSIGIFPLDFWLFSRTAWKRIQPDAVILTESELWPEHLHQCRRRGVPAFLVNARMSERSFRRYLKVKTVAGGLIRQLDRIYAASASDRDRLLQLGAKESSVESTGSIKFDVEIPELDGAPEVESLLAEFGFSDAEAPFVLLGSSTWPGEEAALLAAQASLIEAGVDCRLLLVPRHVERAHEVAALLEFQSLPWNQRSVSREANPGTRIYLADTTGELASLSRVANLAFVGKSLPPNAGGQTPIEAAGLGVPVLFGPNMGNFKAVARALVRTGAAEVVADDSALSTVVLRLARDPDALRSMADAALEWHRANRGSSQRVAADILKRLETES